MSLLGSVKGVTEDRTFGHLEACSLSWNPGNRAILSDVSISVASDEVVGLFGRDGAGKTSLFELIAGFGAASSGAIRFNGVDITARAADERARLGLSYLPEEPSIFRDLSVQENIQMALDFSCFEEAYSAARLEELLCTFQLERVRHQSATSLSGGERRRCEIARAMATNPKIFILDEPFRGLDPMSVREVANAIAGLKGNGVGALVSDYDLRDLIGLIDRAYVLHEGRVIFSGDPEQMLSDPRARHVYLGEQFSL